MKETILQIALIIMSLFVLGFPFLATVAVNKLTYLYSDKQNLAGFQLKKSTWGPSYKMTHKIKRLTKDEDTRRKAAESILYWRCSFLSLFLAILNYLFILGLQGIL